MNLFTKIIHLFLPPRQNQKSFLSSFSMADQQYKQVNLLRRRNTIESQIEGVETFDKQEALEINRARLEHLESVDLPVQGKSVLDVGCGVGHLAQFFVEKGCQVFCIDGRDENIASLQARYPGLKSAVVNIEEDKLSSYGLFDIVFCYGLLYHLESPAFALKNIASACKELLLVETCITDHSRPLLQWVEETATCSQSLTGIGSRPTPSYIVIALLNAGFSYVYTPLIVPDYPDFKFSWRDDLSHWRDGHPLRQVFVASKSVLANTNLMLVGQCD